MFKWQGSRKDARTNELDTISFSAEETNSTGTQQASPTGFCRVFEGRTRYLRKLHCHSTTLQPGDGYPPHQDAYDVAIVVLRGTLETLDTTVGPYGVIFYAAGEPHGMKNVGNEPAFYLVFEFHRDENILTILKEPHALTQLTLRGLRFSKRAIKSLLRRVRRRLNRTSYVVIDCSRR
jgi:quercetin dioxygenase-like cupin family protein